MPGTSKANVPDAASVKDSKGAGSKPSINGAAITNGYGNNEKDSKPWKVATDPIVGRYMVATRDIKAGELLLQEPPLVLGPKTITEPLCLGCYRPVNGDFTCPYCGFPMCERECCSAEDHQPECKAVQDSGVQVKVSVFDSDNCMYECITPLRILALRDTNFRLWNTIKGLESHSELRGGTEVAAITETTVVDIIQTRLRLQEYDTELINQILGIIDTNAFEIRLPDSSIMGVYGKAALLEHSCIPNTHRTFDADLNLLVRAAVDIEKGEHLKSCYTDSLSPTNVRQEHLLTSKFFTCCCNRCLDPTELGTYTSCMMCPLCKDKPTPRDRLSDPSYGVAVPQDPQSASSPWECLTCKSPIDAEYQVRITSVVNDEAEELESGDADIEACEDFLSKWQSTFHHNYSALLNVKYMLIHLYGSEISYDDMNPMQVITKETHCRQLLEVADIIVPGISRLRGSVLYELYQTLYHKCKKLYRVSAIESDLAKDIAQEACDYLVECVRVLSYEPPVQPEGQLALEAKEELDKIRIFIRLEGWK